MAITYPRTLPTTPGIKSNEFELDFNVDEHESPITRQSTFDHKFGDQWQGMYVYPPMSALQAREWKAWFASMHGPVKTFYAGDPDNTTPAGVADTGTSTPLVKGGSQTGRSILSDGWASSTVGLLLAGDMIQIGTELKIVTETVSSSGADATINFEPALHDSPADNATIVFENPVGIFRMVENSVPWQSNEFGVHDFAFAFVEVF
jgi:hypothetical protein